MPEYASETPKNKLINNLAAIMANKIYYLSTCDTCARIMEETGVNKHKFVKQDIKHEPVTAEQIDALKEEAGSYEALFSKRALLYKEMGLGQKKLTEKDYRRYLLEHYTFLKRPVVNYNGKLFTGNDKKTVAALKEALAGKK